MYWWFFLGLLVSAAGAKLCCDQECTRPISYGRTTDRYITQETGHLSFPNAAIVTILIKQAEYSSGEELWFAEIQGREGLVPAQVVTELHTLCEPKVIEKVKQETADNNENEQTILTSTPIPYVPHSGDFHSTKSEWGLEEEVSIEQQSLEQPGVGSVHYDNTGEQGDEQEYTAVNTDDSSTEFLNQEARSFEEGDNFHDQQDRLHLEEEGSPVTEGVHRIEQTTAEAQGDPQSESALYTEDNSLPQPSPEQQHEEPANGENILKSEANDISHSVDEGHFDEETILTVKDDSATRTDGESFPGVQELSSPFDEVSVGDTDPQENIPKVYHPHEADKDNYQMYEGIHEEHLHDTISHTGEQTQTSDRGENIVQQSEAVDVTRIQEHPLYTPGPTEQGNAEEVHERGDNPVSASEGESQDGLDLEHMYNRLPPHDWQSEPESFEEENAGRSEETVSSYEHSSADVTSEGYPSYHGVKREGLYNDSHILKEGTPEAEQNIPSPTETIAEVSTGYQGQHPGYLNVHSLRQRYHKGGMDSDTKTDTKEFDIDHTMNEVTNSEMPTSNGEQASMETSMSYISQDNTRVPLPHIQQNMQHVPPPPDDTERNVATPNSNTIIDHEGTRPHERSAVEQESQQHEPYKKQQEVPLPVMEQPFSETEPPMTVGSSNDQLEYNLEMSAFIAQFSPQLAEFVTDKVHEFGFVGILASVLCLVIPLCCSCCHFWKDSRRKATTISKHAASRKGLEDQIEKLKTDKKAVNTELLVLEEKCGSLENELEQLKHSNQILSDDKVDLEENYRSVSGELESLQKELSTCTTRLNQLHSELKHEQMQLSAQTSEKDVALQQIALLQNQMRKSEQKVQELEAVKEQLEQDSFSTHTRYQELEELNRQVTEELATTKSENTQLHSNLQALQEEVESLHQIKNDNAEEIQTLQDCLSQLVAGTAGDHQEGVDGTTMNTNSADTLHKIQAMLDTTKVQAELQDVTEERDKSIAALEEQSKRVKTLQEENAGLCEHSNQVEAQLTKSKTELQRLQEKHKTLTEYFEQKEHNLHRMLGAEEAVRQAVETREAQVKEKAESLEETETRHREELKQLRSEMFEIEKSLMSQVHTCQKRAEDAIAEQRRLEQECKALKLEREDLRKRVPSSVSRDHDQRNVHIVRPPSAPYLPRTSSPGVADAEEHVTSMLSQTDPLPGSLPQPPVSNTGHPTPFFVPQEQRATRFPPFQPPLQHPLPEHGRPHYPIPPHGRRVIRGYPPFDRRPPRPGVYGPPPRFYHDARDRVPERRRPLSNPPPGARSTPPLGIYDGHGGLMSRNMQDASAGFVPVDPALSEHPPNHPGEQASIQRSEGGTL